MLNLKNYIFNILTVVILLFCYTGVVRAGLTVPSNDLCADASNVSVPSTTSGYTINATNDGAAACGGATAQGSPGVWYTVTGTGNTITASFCTALYDSNCCTGHGSTGCDDSACKATVCASDSVCCSTGWDNICAGEALDLCGSLCSPACVTGSDDSCGFQSQVSWCSQAGATYRILVHGYGSAAGYFDLDVSDDGIGCTPTVVCEEGGNCEEAQAAAQDAVDSGGPCRKVDKNCGASGKSV
jgi:hypothetical protein